MISAQRIVFLSLKCNHIDSPAFIKQKPYYQEMNHEENIRCYQFYLAHLRLYCLGELAGICQRATIFGFRRIGEKQRSYLIAKTL